MRISNSGELSRGVLAGIIMAVTYTIVTLGMQISFTPEGAQFLPFGIVISSAYMFSFSDMIIKAYIFCIAGGLFGAYSVSRQAYKPEGGPGRNKITKNRMLNPTHNFPMLYKIN